MDRITSGSAGTETYGDTSHVHAATNLSSVSNLYASYDAMGNMTCRNASSSQSCASGAQTGAIMTYDNEGRLSTWTAPSGTTGSQQYLYDNGGNRLLQQQSTSSGSNTVITFDGFTDTTVSNGSKSTTKYYHAGGQTVAEATGTAWYELVPDLLGSAVLALKGNGSVQAVQLYAPYGSSRYSVGAMPTAYNFTGQRLDSQTGLLYYNARYYDPVSGRFTSADAILNNTAGIDPYAYVSNNPMTWSDPSGYEPVPLLIIGLLVDPIAAPLVALGFLFGSSVAIMVAPNQVRASGGVQPVPTPTPTPTPSGSQSTQPGAIDLQLPQQNADGNQTQTGGGGQGAQPPGGNIAPSPSPDEGNGSSSPLNQPSQSSVNTARSILQDLQQINSGLRTNPAATATWETDRGFVLTDSITKGTPMENQEFGNCAERQCLGITSKIGASPMMDSSENLYAQMYEFQVNARMPCGDCQAALRAASVRYGPIRVWGGMLDSLGNMNALQYMDFVSGEAYGPFLAP